MIKENTMITGSLSRASLAVILYKTINGYEKILPITTQDCLVWKDADQQLYYNWLDKIFGSIRACTLPDLEELSLLDITDFKAIK